VKILQIFNKVPYPPKDGGSIAVTALAEGFAKAGNKVNILCLNTKKHYANIKKIKHHLPENISLHAVDINTDIKLTALIKNLLFSKKPYIAERFMSPDFEKNLENTLKKEKFDIIQIEGLYMMPYIKTIKKHTDAAISFRAHNIEHEIWQLNLKKEKNPVKKTYLKILVKRLKKFETSFLDKYDCIIPITERDGKIFRKLGNKKPVHVSPAGIDTKKYNTKQQDFSEIKLFHLGSLDWTPNIEGLLWFLKNVWTKLSETYPDLTFTLAGRNISEKFKKHLSTYKNVIFKGETDDAIKFMNEHNTMPVPLFSGSGMRIKIIEGMACGNVIISTPKGAEGIHAENGKEILIAETPDDFVKQINTIISNRKKAKQISDAAKHFVSVNFDNFAISESLLNFYRRNIIKK